MKHYNVKSTLIERVITVIAAEGLDKTTTKSIVEGTGLNEAYIYRTFEDKEDLIAATFEFLDNELYTAVSAGIDIMYDESLSFEVRCRAYYDTVWQFLLGSKDRTLAYTRYFYSPYFQKHSAGKHTELFIPLVQRFAPAFKSDAHVWMLMHHCLNVLFDFAIRVFDGDCPNDADTAEHVFRLIYFSLKPYFAEK
ncbi:MAG: TetR/AcrR family transcriptional regulator [Clostridia bacterium]|nr:TetR/AcrR family transcriptional regulator [Clostridia bacterium]